MNISMMDSYNLAWKLIYQVNRLAPPSTPDNPTPLLNTYQTERHETAQQLIDFDRKFSTMFSGQMGTTEGLTQDEFQQAFKLNNGFTSGCGVEYPENMLVVRDGEAASSNPVQGTDYLSGILRPGRRLLNVRLLRHADGGQRDLHDGKSQTVGVIHVRAIQITSNTDTPSTGRFRILCLASNDLLDRASVSAKALEAITLLANKFPASTIEQIVLHPRLHRAFEWDDIPACVKQAAEMRFYDGSALDDAYNIYGVDSAHGALAVIRPDGYVGIVSQLRDVSRLEQYLTACIRTVS
jgi:phenol 2-monooxygenase